MSILKFNRHEQHLQTITKTISRGLLASKCNIPLWRTDKTYSLRTLARKWSGFYDDEPLNLDDDASWLMTGCFTIAVYRCYWLSFIECAGFRTLRMQRHRWNSLGLQIESGSGLLSCFIYDDIVLFWWYILILWYVVDMIWHDGWWCRLMIACRPDSHME